MSAGKYQFVLTMNLHGVEFRSVDGFTSGQQALETAATLRRQGLKVRVHSLAGRRMRRPAISVSRLVPRRPIE